MVIDLLSKYRAELMGFSMLMVMLFHTIGGLSIPGMSDFKPFICFDFGVEFFIVLSAIGCTYSLDKNRNTIDFYKRRLKRIIPAFVIVVALDFIVYDLIISGTPTLKIFFKNLLFISFGEGDISFWFILYILTCYLLTPFVYRHSSSKAIIGIIGLATCILFIYAFSNTHTQNVLLYRFPIYFLTLVWVNRARNYSSGWNFIMLGILTLIVYASLILFIRYPYKYLLYMGAAIPCLVFVAMVIDKMQNRLVNIIFSFIGGISLELYLIHEKCLYLSDMISTNIAFRIVFSFAVAITLSYLLHVSLF